MTNLERIRKAKGLTVEQLAEKAEQKEAQAFSSSYCFGGMLHYKNIIRFLEGEKIVTPRPRKTIEYKFIAKALNCSIAELMRRE
ncbi:hypothetical protein OGZ51_12305 [Lactococcus lactis]|uniref:HTH cro/C1-type domain-containing protein n=1 Tax=Lactococcus lactis TaxID=1358 RepID=A0A9X4NKA8_9LACT|nr:hypothetical protein [Lactococcus lactis]MDG4984927.1 hypothetical protein [Lactococcus lactis]